MSVIALSPEGLPLSPRLRQIEERAALLGLLSSRYSDKSEDAPSLHVRDFTTTWWLIFSDTVPAAFIGAGTRDLETFQHAYTAASGAYVWLTEGLT